jgi:Pectinacetylesterase
MKHFVTFSRNILILLALFGCEQKSPTQTTPGSHPKTTGAIAHTPIAISTGQPQNTSVASPDNTLRPTTELAVMPTLTDLPSGWSEISPGGDTSCARGGPYSFFVRKTNSNKLLIYFEGGGSCYDAKTCKVGADYFDDSIDPASSSDNPSLKTTGVFALDDDHNPFKDYNFLFISYCTGDAFVGTKQVSFSDKGKSFTVNQVGFTNTQSALGWAHQNFSNPESIFVIGCSAGVVGSFFNAPYMLEQYPDIPFTLIGDSGGGFIDGPVSYLEEAGALDVLPAWLPQYLNLVVNDTIQTRLFFVIPPLAYPNARFGLLDTLGDSVQSEIIARFNKKLTFKQVLQSNLDSIRADVPDFYSYTGPGNYHCITMDPEYYKYTVNGTKLSDWIANLANGQTVENIMP